MMYFYSLYNDNVLLMEKLIIFGGTGGTGMEVIKQALEKGFLVTAIIRQPHNFQLQHSLLKIVKGDVMQPASYEQELVNAHAIISCLGSGRSTKPTRVYSQGISNIISAMSNTGVRRLICVSAGALYVNKEMGLFNRILIRLLLEPILKEPYADMRLMEGTILNSQLDWSIVRPARLTNKPVSGKYRAIIDLPIKRPFSISRADLAHYLLSIVDAPATVQKIISIAY
jgi:putative NADH-flavin reductase